MKGGDHPLEFGILLAVTSADIIENLQLLDGLVELVGLEVKLTQILVGALVFGLRFQRLLRKSQCILVVLRLAITEIEQRHNVGIIRVDIEFVVQHVDGDNIFRSRTQLQTQSTLSD